MIVDNVKMIMIIAITVTMIVINLNHGDIVVVADVPRGNVHLMTIMIPAQVIIIQEMTTVANFIMIDMFRGDLVTTDTQIVTERIIIVMMMVIGIEIGNGLGLGRVVLQIVRRSMSESEVTAEDVVGRWIETMKQKEGDGQIIIMKMYVFLRCLNHLYYNCS